MDNPAAQKSSRTPQDLLYAFHQAMIHKSPEEFAALYAENAHYEFPFITPGRPKSYNNRQEIYDGFKKAWDNAPVRVDTVDDIVIYQTTDPHVIIAEQKIHATVLTSGQQFTRPAVLILFAKDGLIVRLRDYADVLSGVKEMGRIDILVETLRNS